MADFYGNNEPDWIKRVKSKGAFPFLDPNNCSNGWSTPPADSFRVRGPDYLTKRVKIPGGEYLLEPIGFDWIQSSRKLPNVMKNPKNHVMRALEAEFPAGNKPLVWAFNLQFPTKDNHSMVAYFGSINPIPEGSLMEQFLNGDDKFRISRLKMITNFIKGPWLLEKAIQREPVCIVGRILTCKYYVEESFIEVDIDIGSTIVASTICRRLFGYLKTITVDLAFLIEGHTESELPEKILGAIRFSDLDPDRASLIDQPNDDSNDISQGGPSLSTRLWKSLGQGISKLIHPSARENGRHSSSSRDNGVVEHENGEEEMRKWLRLSI